MVRRTVVIAPPPAAGADSRRTVVVRAGPPKKRGSRLDAVVGVLGAALVVFSALLVQILPEEEIVLPQFQVSFEEVPGPDQPTSRDAFAEGETKAFEYLIEEDSITAITFTIGWEDDVAASEPDQFRVRLIDPDGVEVLTKLHANAAARRNAEPQGGEPMFVADPFEARLGYSPNSRPQSLIVEGVSRSETADDVLERVAPDYVAGGAGVWTIEVTLVDAGDCSTNDLGLVPVPLCTDPAGNPIGSPDDPANHDTGNEFAVTLFTYTRYEPVVTALS